MEAIKNALAHLAAAKARVYDLIEPEKEIAARLEGVIHALVAEVESLGARLKALEAGKSEPAQPDAGAGAKPTATDEATSPAAAQTAAPAASSDEQA